MIQNARARAGLLFPVHRKVEGGGGQGGVSLVVGGAAAGRWEAGGAGFDSGLARIVTVLS